MTRRKSHPWVQPMFSYSDVLVLSTADGDAGAEGREEGSVWLYAHQLAALNSARVHPRTLPPVVTPRYTENKPSSETSTHARRFSSQRIYKIGTLFYFLSYHLLSEAFMEIMHHKGSGLFGDDFYTTDVLHYETHACEISLIVSIVVGFGTVFICFLWSIICLLYFLVFNCIMYSRMHW